MWQFLFNAALENIPVYVIAAAVILVYSRHPNEELGIATNKCKERGKIRLFEF